MRIAAGAGAGRRRRLPVRGAGATKPPSARSPLAPTAIATISGGIRAASPGHMLTSRKAAVIGAAIHTPASSARTQSSPNCRKTPATMPMTIGIGTASMARRTKPVRPSASISRPGRDIGADDLSKAEVGQRGPDQDGAGNGPEERQRLTVGEREGDGDEPVDEERAEQPGGEIGLSEAATRAGREDDGHRAGRRKQEADQRAGGVRQRQIAPEPRGAGGIGKGGAFEGHGWGRALRGRDVASMIRRAGRARNRRCGMAARIGHAGSRGVASA